MTILEEIHSQIKQCNKITNKNFCVVGLGGKDSWLTTLAANDILGYYQVLAVNIYSIFSNSTLPFKISAICQNNNIQYCDVDITNAINEILSLQIGLFRIEKEKLHYMMTDLQKNEISAMIRDTVLRGIADRHDGMFLSGINMSKRLNGWMCPSQSIYDWNPLFNCTANQVQSSIIERGIGTEILEIPTGLDLNTKGGPFPQDYQIDFSDDENLVMNEKLKNNPRVGLGIYQ